jgi:hypothetical protein
VRSARIVGDWLRESGAADGVADDVAARGGAPHVGGGPREDLLQAADSLSFLEVNVDLVRRWYTDGRCTRERAKEQLDHMYERMRVERARQLGRPLLEEGIAHVDRA